MNNWKEVVEEGSVIYVNEEVGNVVKTPDGKYVCMIPKVIKLGPFDTLDVAQSVAEDKENLERNLENFNLNLVNFSSQLKE